MTDIQTLADTISAAFARGPQDGSRSIGSLAADVIDASHVPAKPTDAPAPGLLVGEALALKWSVFEAALEGFVFTSDVKVAAPDTLLVDICGAGTIDGQDGTVAATITLGVREGKLVSMTWKSLGNTDENAAKLEVSPAAAAQVAKIHALRAANS